MTRINMVLLLAVVISAIYLVNIQYESRRLFTELDKAKAEERRLASDLERLKVEKRAQATPARVDRIAREKLQMRLVLPAITTYVGYTEAAAPGTSANASAPALQNSTALAVPEAKP